jgi:hypothetical protein
VLLVPGDASAKSAGRAPATVTSLLAVASAVGQGMRGQHHDDMQIAFGAALIVGGGMQEHDAAGGAAAADLVPVVEESLRAAMRDPRYWRSGHPEREEYNRWVTEGWRAVVNEGRGMARRKDRAKYANNARPGPLWEWWPCSCRSGATARTALRGKEMKNDEWTHEDLVIVSVGEEWPRSPPKNLVSYLFAVDRDAKDVLLIAVGDGERQAVAGLHIVAHGYEVSSGGWGGARPGTAAAACHRGCTK